MWKSITIKAYRCLNLSTHKIIESAHVRIEEFFEKSEEESNKEAKDNMRFVYYKLDTLPNIFGGQGASPLNSLESQKYTKLQLVQP